MLSELNLLLTLNLEKKLEHLIYIRLCICRRTQF